MKKRVACDTMMVGNMLDDSTLEVNGAARTLNPIYFKYQILKERNRDGRKKRAPQPIEVQRQSLLIERRI